MIQPSVQPGYYTEMNFLCIKFTKITVFYLSFNQFSRSYKVVPTQRS